MKNTRSNISFKIYEFILGMAMAVFSVLLLGSLINSFYTFKPKKVNVPSFSSIAWGLDNIKLRQERIYNGAAYLDKKQLLVSGVSINSVSALDDMPVTLLARDRKTIKAKYYPLTNNLLISVSDKQVSELKIWLGLIRSFYIFLIVIGIWQVRKMLLSVKNNTYFQAKNAKRLQYAAFVFFLMPICSRLFSELIEYYLVHTFEIKQLDFVNNHEFSIQLWLVAGIVTVVLAFIVSQGNKLEQENELTI
jgi:hypothetical protein